MTCPGSCTPQPKNHLVPPTGANGSHSKQNAVCGRYEVMENKNIINIHIHIYILDAPKAFVISWYEHDSNQTLMMTTKLVNVDPVAEKDVNAAK